MYISIMGKHMIYVSHNWEEIWYDHFFCEIGSNIERIIEKGTNEIYPSSFKFTSPELVNNIFNCINSIFKFRSQICVQPVAVKNVLFHIKPFILTGTEFIRFLLFDFLKSFESNSFKVNLDFKNLDHQGYLKWVRSTDDAHASIL